MRGCTCRGLTLCDQCQQLAQRAGVLPPLVDASRQPSEAAFQMAVVKLARSNNWLWYHTHDSRRSPSGFVDGVLAKAGQPLYMVELKTDAGQVTPAQAAWLTTLERCAGVISEVWRPSMWEEIGAKLRT